MTANGRRLFEVLLATVIASGIFIIWSQAWQRPQLLPLIFVELPVAIILGLFATVMAVLTGHFSLLAVVAIAVTVGLLVAAFLADRLFANFRQRLVLQTIIIGSLGVWYLNAFVKSGL